MPLDHKNRDDLKNLKAFKKVLSNLVTAKIKIKEKRRPDMESPEYSINVEGLDKPSLDDLKTALQALGIECEIKNKHRQLELVIKAQPNQNILNSIDFTANLIKAFPSQKKKQPFVLAVRSYRATMLHGNADTVDYQNTKWRTVNLGINWVEEPQGKWVSLGSSKGRERLFFDENSRLVSTLHEKAREECQGKSISEVLAIVNDLINQLTDVPNKTRKQIEKELDTNLDKFLLGQAKTEEGYIDLTFDQLAQKNLLVCRHKAIIAASILGMLVNVGILPPGTVRQFRSNLKESDTTEIKGAHTWSLYRDLTSGELWICDPRWNTAKIVDPDFSNVRNYGKATLKEMVSRSAIEDEIFIEETRSEPPIFSPKPPLNPELKKAKAVFLSILPEDTKGSAVSIKLDSEIQISYPKDAEKRAVQLAAIEQALQLFNIPYAINIHKHAHYICIQPSPQLEFAFSLQVVKNFINEYKRQERFFERKARFEPPLIGYMKYHAKHRLIELALNAMRESNLWQLIPSDNLSFYNDYYGEQLENLDGKKLSDKQKAIELQLILKEMQALKAEGSFSTQRLAGYILSDIESDESLLSDKGESRVLSTPLRNLRQERNETQQSEDKEDLSASSQSYEKKKK